MKERMGEGGRERERERERARERAREREIERERERQGERHRKREGGLGRGAQTYDFFYLCDGEVGVRGDVGVIQSTNAPGSR